ncbi:hypothetical protein IV203_015796 [Nitzschia inconspicua]|uniref:Uncharacterized protein n=1 Tax=Nitzschia inconspicua TaxID=303405 RepID=A0A9K3LBX4_9STRA|nr:hypothetical protein IV203_015796 [Nitzschia inconspicua]
MAPPKTFSHNKNQFDIGVVSKETLSNSTSSTTTAVVSSKRVDDNNGSNTGTAAPSSSVEELTKDLMMMDAANLDDDNDETNDDDLLSTQELDWNLQHGDDDNDNDDSSTSAGSVVNDAKKMETKEKEKKNDEDDLHMEDDGTSEDESSSQSNDSSDEQDVQKDESSPVSGGRKKTSVSPIKETTASEKDVDSGSPTKEDQAASKNVDAETNNHEEDEGDDSDSVGSDNEEEDISEEDDDDQTVAMSEDEDSNSNSNRDIEETSKPTENPSKPTTEADASGEDSDAWLDGSDDEGKKWRDNLAQSEDDDDSDEGEQELDSQSIGDKDADNTGSPADDDSESMVGEDKSSLAANAMDKSGQDLTAATPRRSVRAPKPRKMYSNEHEPTTTALQKKKRVPAKKVWAAVLDQMYADVEDKNSVTTKQMRIALSEKFGCKMNKKWKEAINERLHDLVNGKIKQTNVDVGEDADLSSEEDADDEASVATEDARQDGSDYEDDAKTSRSKRTSKRSRTKNAKSPRRKSRRDSKKSERKAARAAKMIEMQKLRRKQLLEEKVRNEEMQLNQSKEDQERAEAIAAKFETNTDELRLKRLEDRLDLLQQLDQKRISVIKMKDDTPIIKVEPSVEDEQAKVQEEAAVKEESQSEESSSEEEDLVIVGIKKPMKPLKPLQNHLPSTALDVLNGIRSPEAKKFRARRQANSIPFANGSTGSVIITSPSKSMGARFALRNALRQKQRKMGNLWLARELGYKREEDHIKDCMTAAEQKRELVMKLEEERLKANERKNLRERLLLQEANEYEDQNDIGADTKVRPSGEGEDEEEDEELQMAKEIEQESQTEVESHGDEDAPVNGDESQVRIGMETESNGLETQPLETFHPLNGTLKMDHSNKPADGSISSMNPSSQDDTPPLDSEGSCDPVHNTQNVLMEEDEDFKSQLLETQPQASSPEVNDKDGPTIKSESTEALHADDEKHSVSAGNEEGSDEEEAEADFKEDVADAEDENTSPHDSRPKNSLWQEALRREAEKLKKQKSRKGGLVEEEAEEEEEEEVAGLEDFGFTVSKKKKDDDEDEDNVDDELDEEDLKHIVDEVSDNEGDEEAGMAARRRLEAQEEKRLHKEFMRRAREGHDGRRGGIAGGSGARGLHGFDQLVAPDNREDAKRLGLLNDDELDSEDEKEKDGPKDDDEEDETALLDQDLRRRHLLQSDVNVEEDEYSSSEEEEELQIGDDANESDIEEEISQRRLNKLFKKRATMKDYERLYGKSEEFSQQRLIDEDESMKEELKKMRNGLIRRRSVSSSISQSSHSSNTGSQQALFGPPYKRQRGNFGSIASHSGGSLSVALLASRKVVRKTSFLGGPRAGSGITKEHSQSLSSTQFLFQSQSHSNSHLNSSSNLDVGANVGTKRKFGSNHHTTTLFSRVVGGG